MDSVTRFLRVTSLGIATTATLAASLLVPAQEVTDFVGVSIKCPYIPEGLEEIPTCGGKVATCVGTGGHDLILGTDHDDVIVAGPGNDVIHTDAGDDVACGGPGKCTSGSFSIYPSSVLLESLFPLTGSASHGIHRQRVAVQEARYYT